MRPKIRITLVESKGDCPCHRGHKPGDAFDYDTDRGKLCPMAMHVGFPYIDILRFGGMPPVSRHGDVRFCCPDSDVINVFRLEVVEE